jgi:hypothetical protein
VQAFIMGYSSTFFIESKVFELSVVKGYSVLSIVESSRGVSRAVLLGKVSVAWLLGIIESLLQGAALKDFVKSSRVGE